VTLAPGPVCLTNKPLPSPPSPPPTQIGASTLIGAQEICKEGSIKENDKRVTPVRLGQGISGKTERQEGVFYKLKCVRACMRARARVRVLRCWHVAQDDDRVGWHSFGLDRI
jgi:hypothetical protein